MSPSILENQPDLSRLMQDLGNPPGLVFWVDNLEKCNPSPSCLDGLRTFINGMKEGGTSKVISLYGGFLTALFYNYGLDGLSYGVSYGDSKSVKAYPTGGGAPSRYYSPDLHSFQSTRQMYRFFITSLDHARRFTCTCPVCNSTMEAIRAETKDRALRNHFSRIFVQKGDDVVMNWYNERKHFLHVRTCELEEIGRASVADQGNMARSIIAQYEELGNYDLNTKTLELVVRLSELAP